MRRLAALALCVLALPSTAAAADRSWAAPQIETVVEAGLLADSAGAFKPQKPLTQRALGAALAARHEGAELWEIGPPHEPIAEVNRPRFERMEALGIESGRLGSERILP